MHGFLRERSTPPAKQSTKRLRASLRVTQRLASRAILPLARIGNPFRFIKSKNFRQNCPSTPDQVPKSPLDRGQACHHPDAAAPCPIRTRRIGSNARECVDRMPSAHHTTRAMLSRSETFPSVMRRMTAARMLLDGASVETVAEQLHLSVQDGAALQGDRHRKAASMRSRRWAWAAARRCSIAMRSTGSRRRCKARRTRMVSRATHGPMRGCAS